MGCVNEKMLPNIVPHCWFRAITNDGQCDSTLRHESAVLCSSINLEHSIGYMLYNSLLAKVCVCLLEVILGYET